MLPPGARLRSGREIDAVVRGGVRASAGALLTVHLRRTREEGGARVAFAVGRSAGNSVTRNRIRRRLAPLLRARLDTLPAGGDLVVRAGPAVADVAAPALAGAVDAVLARAVVRMGESEEKLAARRAGRSPRQSGSYVNPELDSGAAEWPATAGLPGSGPARHEEG